MDDPTQSDVVGTASVVAAVVVGTETAVVVGISVSEVGFAVVVGGSTMVVPLFRCDVVSPPVGIGGTRMVVELVPADAVGNTVTGTPVPAVPEEEMMLEIMLSRPVDEAVGVSVEVLGAKVVVAPVPVPVPVAEPVGSGIIPPRMDDRRPPSDELEGLRVW